MRTAFIRALIDLARQDERVFLLTPDMGFSVLEAFQREFPNRFLNTGIAEQNTIGVAAGLALSGYIVYVYSITPFVTMRCFEQVRVDLAYQNTRVRLVGVGAGLSYGPAGATHHAIEDIAIMRALPGMTVLCPGDPVEAEQLVKQSAFLPGPVYLRLGKNGEPRIHADGTAIEIGKAVHVRDGADFTLITTGNMLEQGLRWRQEWQDEGIEVRVISMPSIKPFDEQTIRVLIDEGRPVLSLEEHTRFGGLRSAIAEVIADYGKPVRFHSIAIADEYSHYVGHQEFQRQKLNLHSRPKLAWAARHSRVTV